MSARQHAAPAPVGGSLFNATTLVCGVLGLALARILPPGGVCSNDARRVCDAGHPCSGGATCRLYASPGVAEAQVVQPRFLANAAPYRLLRFMDWMETNSSPIVNFADYPTPTSAFWHRVPPQILAELGNRLGSDLWINFPHRASNDFVDQFATVLRDQFRADRRVFVEYGNENWNGIFSQNLEIPRAACPGFADTSPRTANSTACPATASPARSTRTPSACRHRRTARVSRPWHGAGAIVPSRS